MIHETKWRRLMLPELIDLVLGSVLNRNVETPIQLVDVFRQAIDEVKWHYFSAVTEEFDKFVKRASTHGLPSRQSFSFSIPQPNGTVEELFPGGRRVEITPTNFEAFLIMFELYRIGQTPSAAMLPLNPRLHLSSNFSPLIDIIARLNKPGEPWQISRAEWHNHRVVYAVPWNGKLFELVPDGRDKTVDFGDWDRFVTLARKFYKQYAPEQEELPEGAGSMLEKESTALPAPSPQSRSQPATVNFQEPAPPPVEAQPRPVDVDPLKFAPGQTESFESLPTRQSSSVSQYNLATQYGMFAAHLQALELANTPQGETLTEEEFDSLDVHYCVPVAGKIVDLIPNGRSTRVRFADKNRYVKLAQEKLGMTQMRTALPVDLLHNASSQKHGADGVLSPKNYEFDLFQKNNERKTSRPVEQNPKRQQQRNLTPEEMDYHFRTLLRQLDRGKWTEEDIANLKLYFEVPIKGTMCPLFDKGQQTPVTAARKDEFVLLSMQALNMTADSMEMSTQNPVQPAQVQAQPPNQSGEGGTPQIPRREDEAKVGSLFSPQHFESDLFAPYTTTNDLKRSSSSQPSRTQPSAQNRSSSSSEPFVNDEEQRFWEMIGVLEYNGDHSPEAVDAMGLTFVMRFPNGRSFPLRDSGANEPVTRSNVQEFVSLVRTKHDLIHLAFGLPAGGKIVEEDVHFTSYPMEHAETWNTSRVTVRDLSSPSFKLADGLLSGSIPLDRITDLRITYSLAVAGSDGSTPYDLVPNGRNIFVTPRTALDFARRVIYERGKIEAAAHRESIDKVPGVPGTQHSGSGSSFAAKSSPNVVELQRRDSDGFHRRSISTVPLRPDQVEALKELRNRMQVLQSTELTEDQWKIMGLAYCIRALDMSFDLVPDGKNMKVAYADRDAFSAACVRRITEMIVNQEERDKAVVPPVDDRDLALFSPNHFEQDLFAPPQHMMIRRTSSR